LHRWSWPFIAAGTIRALIFPIAGVVFASGGVLLSRLDLLSVLFVVPACVYAFIRQRVYNYRFTESELVVRDGLLTKNVRHISYERIHNVALVRNPIHRMLGVTTVRIETAAGGKPEALLRVVSLEAAEELRRHTLGRERQAASTDSVETSGEATPTLQVPDRELVRLGLISNRGFVVVAAALGAASQVQWWDQDWFKEQYWPGISEGLRARAPGWAGWLFDSGALVGRVLLGLVVLLLLLVIIRVFSMAWYLVRYRGFTLRQKGPDLRADYGLWPEISSVIPVHRIQLVTVSASLLHRWFKRASIDLETAGATDSNSGLGAASGVASTRQWLAPIIAIDRAHGLVRKVLPEIDIEGVEWKPIEARAVRRIVNRFAIAVTPITIGIAVLFALAPIPLSGWHALWLPSVVLTTAWLAARQWVRRTGYALSECAIYFRSGWIGRQVSVVRFVNMQTVSMNQSPFDHRKRMASVAVDTAGAGSMGHRIHIPFLDVDVAERILRRLYDETRASEFRW
jgi:putative membrane protein